VLEKRLLSQLDDPVK